ncbi:MAG: tetratricopeptide repeat protein [Armatimonas sp.]
MKDRLRAVTQAGRWVKQAEPPVGSEQAVVYALAFEKAQGEIRGKLARALLLSDLKTRTYRPEYRDAYFEAASAYPQDSSCAFYVAAIAVHGLIETDDAFRDRLLSALLEPAWRKSPLWTKLQLSRDGALNALAGSSAGEAQIGLLESAFRSAPERSEERLRVGRRLATLYRAKGQTDENAVTLSRYLLTRDAEDVENTNYLAEFMVRQEDRSGDALLVYEHALKLAERNVNEESTDRWATWLASLYLEMGRVERDTFPILWRAWKKNPNDSLVEAATAYTGALNEDLWLEPELLSLMEKVISQETQLRPVFVQRRWRWEVLLRALALAWGQSERNDKAAHDLYAHAVDVCPEDRDLWGYHASALATNRDTSAQALVAYERAQAGKKAGELVLAMLGNAYLRARAHIGATRPKALAVWQELYLKGLAGPEIAEVLGDSLAQNGDVSDVALHIWESIAEREPNNGRIRSHLGAAYKTRGANSEAIAWYREAARLLPDDFCVLFECAKLLMENTAEAAESVRLLRAAVVLPDGDRHVDTHVLLGEALTIVEKREEAKKVLRKVVEELDPTHTKSILMLAKLNLRYEQDSVAMAEHLYARALEQDPDNPETYRRLAELYRDEGETRLEQAALEKFLQLSSADVDQYRQLADMYMRRADWERAEGALRQIVALGKADKKTYSLLGEVLHARNRVA